MGSPGPLDMQIVNRRTKFYQYVQVAKQHQDKYVFLLSSRRADLPLHSKVEVQFTGKEPPPAYLIVDYGDKLPAITNVSWANVVSAKRRPPSNVKKIWTQNCLWATLWPWDLTPGCGKVCNSIQL